MVNYLKEIVSDILYVSKITKTKNKKRTIFFSVLLTQLIAFADIGIILFFTTIFSDLTVLPKELSYFNFLFEIKILLPLIVAFRYYIQYLQSIVIKKLELAVQMNLKNYVLSQVFENRNFSTADTYYYVNTLAPHISFFYTSIANFLNFFLQSIAFTTYLFFTEPKTISAFLIGILFLIYPIIFLIKKTKKIEHLIYEAGQESSSDVQRVLDNVFLIKLLKKEKDETSRYIKITRRLFDDNMTKHKLTVLNSYLAPFTTVFLISIIALFFNDFFNITLPFMGVTLRMFQSLANMSNAATHIVNSHVHLDAFYQLEKYKVSTLRENYIISDEPKNKILFELKDVDFKYLNSDLPIFNGLNLNIEKGSHTIITGTNGTGKSTLLGLLAGVFYPNSGKVYARSEKFGFVGPNPLIFSMTLRENLMYANKNFKSDEEILEMIQNFNLFEDKVKVDLDIKVNNKSLSSGQMQKIAFMRVLLSDADVLFLDESTSNLDEETKELIFNLILNSTLTIINSTHDIDSFKNYTNHYKIELSRGRRLLKKIV
jgi:ABC-type multidrug transport system fused ATPase/permease subunit